MHKINSYKRLIVKVEQIPLLLCLLKWLMMTIIAGALVGLASMLLLVTLDLATNFRESHLWIIALLLIGELLIGLMYYYLGNSVVKGNNSLIEEIHTKDIISFNMAPLIYVGKFITDLF